MGARQASRKMELAGRQVRPRSVAIVHSNGKLAVLVEMQTGSDAAAASEAFHEVAKNVAMQIAAASPARRVRRGPRTPKWSNTNAKSIARRPVKKVSPNRSSKRSPKARSRSSAKDVCLLDQLYIRDDKMTIGDLIKGAAKTIGSSRSSVVRFVRIQLGAE